MNCDILNHGDKMKKLFLILSIIATYLLIDISFEKEDMIIIYSSLEQYRGDELQRQLNERFPDENILVMYLSTAKSAAKIHTEQDKSDCDIIVGLEGAYMEKIKDHLAPVSNLRVQNYIEGMKPSDFDDRYVIWERQAGSIVMNDKLMQKHGLAPVATYEDLLDEQYRGFISMPDPNTSGTGYLFYKNLVNVMGEEKALAYFDQLAKNIKMFTESGSGPIKSLIQGESAIGLCLTFQAVEQKNEGQPFTIITPEYGSPYSLTGAGLMKGREKDPIILEVFDYIINDFFLYDKMYFSPEILIEDQQREIENYPENIHYGDMEGINDILEKERLLELWKY